MIIFISACQFNIGGRDQSDCTSCSLNGAGNCDPDGCPKKTGIWISYVEKNKQCAGNYREKNFKQPLGHPIIYNKGFQFYINK